ncbi:MAG: sulfotransferase family protein, partial [Rhodanobacteraceae bacterium]
IKTVPVTDAEMMQMRELVSASSRIDASERMAIQYALGAACERVGRYPEAFRMFVEANAGRQRELPAWSPEQFRMQEQQARNAYDAAHHVARDPALGAQVIFIVGMPRSGTTLIEQILASHPQVAGGGELPALPQVLTEESTRRRRRYPEWIPDATADDWQRLGQRYLELTAGRRAGKPRLTDKLPYNWRYLGALRAMLPGARIIVCRRDPLETCWSCFKQYFPNSSAYVNDLELLGVFWRGFDRAVSHWAQVAPASLRTQGYEALTENPEAQIRALLDFCGLPFDAACLKFHESRRSVDTLSATQVRQPMHRHQSIAARYGELLDPLRRALGLPLADSGAPGPLTARSGSG